MGRNSHDETWSKMKFRIFVFCLVLISFSQVWAKDCERRLGALDFGSGTTKAFAAVVDVCNKKFIKVLYEDRIPLALNEALERSSDKIVPETIIAEAMPRFLTLLQKMKDLQVTQIKAVATAVFRTAKNGTMLAKKISTELQVPVTVISQEQEAELGYWSALAQKEVSAQESVIVWDIGGGSMQMYSREKGKVHIYQGDLAAVTYKNKILEVLQFKNPKIIASPNPIGENREAALQLAKNHAYMNVPKYFKDRATQTRWIGVGGVLSLSVQRQVQNGAGEFSRKALDQVLRQRVFLKDTEIDSDYRISDISNLALVLGYMQALNIAKVETVQSSLGQGLIYQSLH